MTPSAASARMMLLGQHLLFGLLLAIAVARAATTGQLTWAIGALLVAGVLWYSAGSFLHGRRRAEIVWFFGLVAWWLGLTLTSAEFSWLAFPLALLATHLLPLTAALVLVPLLTATVVLAQLWVDDQNPVAKILGPVVGSVIAVGLGLALDWVQAESESRGQLVAQLVAAQDDLVALQGELAVSQRESGALAERARLARDIHDTLAQGFSSILLLSRAGLAGTPDDGSRGLLEQIRAAAADGLTEARTVVHALTPTSLSDAPLPAALQRLLDRLAEQAGVEVHLSVVGDPVETPTPIEVALLRLAQGALANVRLHADATRVDVTLTYAETEVLLDVVDDGRGFRPEQVEAAPLGGSGFGLRAMRERIASIGGRLGVESEPGRGTAVAAAVPLLPGGAT